jgi:hypothetical protein
VKQNTLDTGVDPDVCSVEGCEADVPGGEVLCPQCLDERRYADSEADYDSYLDHVRENHE